METPAWAREHNLEACGQYYGGFVDDCYISQYQIAMVTSYGVRKSRTCASVRPNPDKQNEPETEMTDSAVGTACIYCSAMHNYGACYTLFTCTLQQLPLHQPSVLPKENVTHLQPPVLIRQNDTIIE